MAFGDRTGLEESASASLGRCFAAGMFNGEVCGAVTGGLMVLGACLPENGASAAQLGKCLQSRFHEEMGSTLCREILHTHGKKVCDSCVACAAGTVHDLIEDARKEEN